MTSAEWRYIVRKPAATPQTFLGTYTVTSTVRLEGEGNMERSKP